MEFSPRAYLLRLQDRVADPSSMIHKQCCDCGKLLGNCRERCKLFSEATWHVAPKFIKVLSAHLASPEERVSQLLATDSKKPCFSSLDLVTLEKMIHEVNEEFFLGSQKRHFRQRKRELQLLAPPVDFHSLVS